MVLAALLHGQTYLDVRDDPKATKQALLVIVLSSVGLTVGQAFGSVVERTAGEDLVRFVQILTSAFMEWLVMGVLFYWIGRNLMGREITYFSILRVIGFASAPGVLYILRAAGGQVGATLHSFVFIWLVFAMMLAVRHSLRAPYSVAFGMAAVGVVLIGMTIRQMVVGPPV
jgi:hypothetical protein